MHTHYKPNKNRSLRHQVYPNALRSYRVKFLYEVRRLLVAAKPTLVKYRSRFSGRPTQLVAHYGATLD